MSDDLVERVARAACASVNSADTWGETGTDVHEIVWFPIARAAIAVCMEEAAKVCDAIEDRLTEQWKANYKVCDYTQGASDGANDCAAAIRAMIKEKK